MCVCACRTMPLVSWSLFSRFSRINDRVSCSCNTRIDVLTHFRHADWRLRQLNFHDRTFEWYHVVLFSVKNKNKHVVDGAPFPSALFEPVSASPRSPASGRTRPQLESSRRRRTVNRRLLRDIYLPNKPVSRSGIWWQIRCYTTGVLAEAASVHDV